MLIVGMNGFNAAQNRTHLGLWAVSGAPLLAGNNLATMSAETRAILTNREVIAVDQDPAGQQGVKVVEDQTGRQVYSKTLSGTGRRAVLLLNRNTAAATITVHWSTIGLTGPASVRNLWTSTDLGSFTDSCTTTVPANEAVLLTISTTSATPPSSTPLSSTPPSSTPPSSPTQPPAGAACTATYLAAGSWPGGYQGEVTATRPSTAGPCGGRCPAASPSPRCGAAHRRSPAPAWPSATWTGTHRSPPTAPPPSGSSAQAARRPPA